MRINVNDINTSLDDSEYSCQKETKKSQTFLSTPQKQIFHRIKRNYEKLKLKSLMSVCGHNHAYQTFVLCTQAILAICHFMSFFTLNLLFKKPDFLCYSDDQNLFACSQADACQSRYGYKLHSNFSGLMENFGMECVSDSSLMNYQSFLVFGVSLFLGIFFYHSNKLGRKYWFIISSVLQVWGNLIICFSFNFYNTFWGIGMIIIGFIMWVVYLIVYVQEIVEKKAISLAIVLILLLGSLGFFLDMLIIAILRDYRGVSIICMIIHSLASVLYFEYVDSPEYLYNNGTLSEFYSSLKQILQMNFGILNSTNRLNALKGIIFNTDDSSFWVSNLLEGRLHPSARPKDLPKPSKHFLDDSQIDSSDISKSTIVIGENQKTLSAQAPNETENELRIIEKKLFNETDCAIETNTLNFIYEISKKENDSVKIMPLVLNYTFLGVFSLISYHIGSIFLSYSFLVKIDVLPAYWNNLVFALAIFIGILFSCIIAPESINKNTLMIYLVAILVICLNFATIKHSENPYQHDRHFISIPHLLVLHSLIVTAILASSMGFLLIFFAQSIDSNSRATVIGLAVALSCLLIAGMKCFNFMGIFENGLELNILFFISMINIMIIYLMPEKLLKNTSA